MTTTRFEQALLGTATETITVHAVQDEDADRMKFSLTRTLVEQMRKEGGAYKFHVGLQVPVDSPAALAAMKRWVA